MKTRNGFVSNSSSSSFIIEVLRPTETCSHCGIKELDIVDLIKKHSSHRNPWPDDTHVSPLSKEELIEELEEEKECYEEGQIKKELDEAIQKIRSTSNPVYKLNISHGEYGYAELLDWCVDNKLVKILESRD